MTMLSIPTTWRRSNASIIRGYARNNDVTVPHVFCILISHSELPVDLPSQSILAISNSVLLSKGFTVHIPLSRFWEL